MLKGKAYIKVTNEKTGEVRDYESENLVTKASQTISTKFPFYCKDNTKGFEGSRMLGGCMLFNHQVENASEDTIALQELPVAWAGYKANSGTGARGSRVYTSTKLTDDGIQYKWKWTASQGDFTFSSICLGYEDTCNTDSFGATSNTYVGTNSNLYMKGIPFYIDLDNEYYYTLEMPSSEKVAYLRTYQKGTYTKHLFASTNSVDESDEVGRINPYNILVAKDAIDISDIEAYEHNSGKGVGFSYDTKTGMLYIYKIYGNFSDTSGIAHNNKVVLYSIDINQKTSEYTILDLDGAVSSGNYLIDENINTAPAANAVLIYDGYAYFKCYDGSSSTLTDILKVNVNNAGNYQSLGFKNLAYGLGTGFVMNGLYYDCVSGANVKIMLLDTYEIITLSDTIFDISDVLGSAVSINDLFTIHFYDDLIYLGICKIYLGTINNLSTPISKSSSETLEITYILSES